MAGDDQVSDSVPSAPIRVLLIDDDQTSLLVLEQMLENKNYEVTRFSRARDAVEALRTNKEKFDIVICDAHMPDLDGFKVLKIVESEMKVPVVMISSDSSHESKIKGIVHGASDYIVKPIQPESLKFVSKHVARRQPSLIDNSLPQINNRPVNEVAIESGAVASSSNSKDSKPEGGLGSKQEVFSEYQSAPKKPRLIWTPDLHQKFVEAVERLTAAKAVPKKILIQMREMGVTYLTRENVASHLQKYRLHLKKKETSSDNSSLQSVSLNGSKESNFRQSLRIGENSNSNSNVISSDYQSDLPPHEGSIINTNQVINILHSMDQTHFMDQTMAPEMGYIVERRMPPHTDHQSWHGHCGTFPDFQSIVEPFERLGNGPCPMQNPQPLPQPLAHIFPTLTNNDIPPDQRPIVNGNVPQHSTVETNLGDPNTFFCNEVYCRNPLDFLEDCDYSFVDDPNFENLRFYGHDDDSNMNMYSPDAATVFSNPVMSKPIIERELGKDCPTKFDQLGNQGRQR